ncbi:MAG: hypothetical protein A2142_09095 [candidate division Zixibacteria bacterium RBG_16_48_11]|nr:MAG: hypothetical protein A2142_09095 [candidate division Zixibacteria bacterium RBG_16_48_11]
MGSKFWLAVIVVFIVFAILQFVVHPVLLAKWYKGGDDQHLWRTGELYKGRIFWHFISALVFSILFCLIYTKGFESGRGFALQGFRYGIYAGLLMYLPAAISDYVVLHVSTGWFLAWRGLLSLLVVIICGLFLGVIYKPAPKQV